MLGHAMTNLPRPPALCEPLERRRLLSGDLGEGGGDAVVRVIRRVAFAPTATTVVLAGATVWVDDDLDGARDPGEPTAVTDATGAAAFGGLAVGVVHVARVELPRGLVELEARRIELDLVFGGGAEAAVTLVPGAAAVEGVVFRDTDADGVRDSGEPAAGGVEVFADLDGDGQHTVASEPRAVAAGADGAYRVLVPAGAPAAVFVQYNLPAIVTAPTGGGGRAVPALAVGQTLADAGAGLDFGIVNSPGMRFRGAVYHDLNNDGEQDPNEAHLPFGQVFIDLDDDGTRDLNEPTSPLSAGGGYDFARVTTAASINVLPVLQPGWSVSGPFAYFFLNYPGGQTLANVDFGVRDFNAPQYDQSQPPLRYDLDEQAWRVRLTEPVRLAAAPLAPIATLRHAGTGAIVPGGLVIDQVAGRPDEVRVRRAAGAGPLPDGEYEFAFASNGAVRDHLGNVLNYVERTVEFKVLDGDLTGDGAVGFDDLARVAAGYGAYGRAYTGGDATRDGVVDFADLAQLAARYGTALPAPRGVAGPPSKTRVADGVLGA